MKDKCKRLGIRGVALIMAICFGSMIFFVACSGNGGGSGVNGSPESKSIRAVFPLVGSEVNLANDDVAAFMENYQVGDSALYYGKGDNYKMKGVTLTFTTELQALNYKVLISSNKDMSKAKECVTQQTEAHFDDLYINHKYYWQVYATCSNETVISDIFTFTTSNTLRTIDIEGVSNARDIGGKQTIDGNIVKQGMLYRAAILDNVTPMGKEWATTVYRIKTDLDFRNFSEVGTRTTSPLGESVKFIHISAPYYLGNPNGIDYVGNWESIRQYMKVFANANNYPILYHCSVGRDRTGIATMLLLGLLGVSERDIFIDYEASFFSERGCLDGASVDSMVTSLRKTMEYIKNTYGGTEDNFQKKCTMFLLNVGVALEEIISIQNIMWVN